jgi:small redox-active disulfide protein 2
MVHFSKGEGAMKIQVLGTGCPKCKKLFENAQAAVQQAGSAAEVVKVQDIAEITNFGVMITPALAIDGDVKSVGKVLSPDDIRKLIAG